MAQYTSTTSQIIQPTENIAFENTAVSGKCNIKHREGSGLVILHGSGNCHNKARYKVNVHVVTTNVTGQVAFAITLDGEPLKETSIGFVPAAITDYWSGSAETEIIVGCDCSTISIRNIGTTTPTVTAASIVVERIA